MGLVRQDGSGTWFEHRNILFGDALPATTRQGVLKLSQLLLLFPILFRTTLAQKTVNTWMFKIPHLTSNLLLLAHHIPQHLFVLNRKLHHLFNKALKLSVLFFMSNNVLDLTVDQSDYLIPSSNLWILQSL